jgi:acetyl esterase/lipase
VLHAGPAAYSSLVVLRDLSIGLLFERGQQSAYEGIAFAHFTLDWLTGGEDRLKAHLRSGAEREWAEFPGQAEGAALSLTRDIPYATAHERQVLDVYAPAGARNLPVVFWIHGGGWQTGDKSMVALKPQAFMDAGFVFVSINHRLLPTVEMSAITQDVASALGWVHRNIAKHGGHPGRLLVMGHSSGGQLAALLCTDDRYARAEGVALAAIKGCVPVDADTFDIPAIIEMAETRARVHHLPMPTFGHRQKFGDDPAKHRDFSTVTHVARNKGIPPFLVLHIGGNPDTGAQARRLAGVLESAGISVKVVSAREATHASLNDNIGKPDDPVTAEVFAFVARALER